MQRGVFSREANGMFRNMLIVLISYSIFVIIVLIYMTITYFVTLASLSDDMTYYIDEHRRYHQQYYRFTGNFYVDTIMHGLNMLIL